GGGTGGTGGRRPAAGGRARDDAGRRRAAPRERRHLWRGAGAMTAKKKIAILISGRGSNMSALIRAAAEADYPAEIVAVLSDNEDAPGLKAAHAAGIYAEAIARAGFADKAA